MAMAEPRVRVPSTAKQGEIIEVKTLISHPMETGHSRDVYGKLIPRYIIHTFTCTYNGVEVFRADWHPAIAANPYLTLSTVPTESGRLQFECSDDKGTVSATEAESTVVRVSTWQALGLCGRSSMPAGDSWRRMHRCAATAGR